MEDNNKKAPLEQLSVEKGPVLTEAQHAQAQKAEAPKTEAKQVEKKEAAPKEAKEPVEVSATPVADKLRQKLAKEAVAPKKGKVKYSETEDESTKKESFNKRIESILASDKSDSDKLADLSSFLYKQKK